MDGKDVKEYGLEDLRERIGVVPQKSVLFAGTIRSNMQWGKPDATEEEIFETLEIAQAKEVVLKKEDGLDTEVEQGGKNFSGGQRQRLTIARALVKKPEILILDDSSSALDFATDAALRMAIGAMEDKPTLFTFFVLRLINLPIYLTGIHQFLMRSKSDHIAIIQYHNLICILDRRSSL